MRISGMRTWQDIFDDWNCEDLEYQLHNMERTNLMDWLEKYYDAPSLKQSVSKCNCSKCTGIKVDEYYKE